MKSIALNISLKANPSGLMKTSVTVCTFLREGGHMVWPAMPEGFKFTWKPEPTVSRCWLLAENH